MTRLEENRIVVNEMTKRAECNPTGTYEEMVTFQLGAIATMLADLSKSLAILADRSLQIRQKGANEWKNANL